jgi:hypothetical protein
MTNETVANIAITVTAAMLATAAVAFTLSGNAPVDPGAADLPLVSVGSQNAHAAAPGTEAAAPPASGSLPARTAASAPSTVGKPSVGSGVVTSGSSASSVSGAVTSGSGASHQPDEEDDHEVVVPEVHETDEVDEVDDPKKPEEH